MPPHTTHRLHLFQSPSNLLCGSAKNERKVHRCAQNRNTTAGDQKRPFSCHSLMGRSMDRIPSDFLCFCCTDELTGDDAAQMRCACNSGRFPHCRFRQLHAVASAVFFSCPRPSAPFSQNPFRTPDCSDEFTLKSLLLSLPVKKATQCSCELAKYTFHRRLLMPKKQL